LFKNFHDVTRKEFRAFCNSYILNHRGIQAIEWIPRVSYSLRDAYENAAQVDGYPAFQITKQDLQGNIAGDHESKEYFPVYYVEPYRENEIALGLDLATNPVLLGALNRSRDTGEMVTTTGVAQIPHSSGQNNFFVLLPVYYNQAPINTVKERRENLIGFVLGVFRIGGLIEESLSHLKEKNVDFHLYDITVSQNNQYLSTHSQRVNADGKRPVVKQKTDENRLQVYHSFNVADRKWSVLCKPVPEFIENRTTWHPWGFLVSGLLFSGLIVAYLRNTTGRTIQVEQLVSKLSAETAERKRVKEAQREKEVRFRSLVESSIDGIFAYDIDLRYTLWNKAMEQISGIGSEGLVGRKVFDVLPFSEEAGGANSFKETLDGHTNIRAVMPYNFPETGKSGHFESLHFPLYDAQGRTNGGMAIIRDITGKKRLEDALNESEEKNRKLIDSSQDAIICIDENGIIKVWSRSAERIFGYSNSEIVGQPVTIIIPDKYKERHRKGLERFLQTGKTKIIGKTVEVSGKTMNGFEIPIEISLSFQKIGNELTFTAIAKDITFQKEAKKQLIEKLKEAEKANKELNDFANILSRNLKEPLLSIEDYCTRLSKVNEDTFDEKGKTYIKKIKSDAEIMSKRFYQIMEVVKIGMVAYDFKNIDIEALAIDAVDALEREIEKNKIKVLVQHTLPNVLCDKKRMADVLTNLLTNAIKFMGDSTEREIKVGCERDNDHHKIFIEDTGIGIGEKDQDHIFKIFTRLKVIEAEGAGAGLAIIKKIVEIHKGRIWVESPVKNGRGSRFCFTIPALPEPGVEAGRQVEEETTFTEEQPENEGMRE